MAQKQIVPLLRTSTDLDFWLDVLVGAAGATATAAAGRFGGLPIVLSVHTVTFFLFIISFSLELKIYFQQLVTRYLLFAWNCGQSILYLKTHHCTDDNS